MTRNAITPVLRVAATIVAGILAIATSPLLAEAPQDSDDKRTLDIKLRNTVTLEARLGGCEAKLALEYLQKGSQAEVGIEINNDECAASYGDFTIHVRYRHDNGEMFTDEFPETWSREDDQPVKMSRLYPIGDNVDLIRVRSRGLNCSCGVEGETEGEGSDEP